MMKSLKRLRLVNDGYCIECQQNSCAFGVCPGYEEDMNNMFGNSDHNSEKQLHYNDYSH